MPRAHRSVFPGGGALVPCRLASLEKSPSRRLNSKFLAKASQRRSMSKNLASAVDWFERRLCARIPRRVRSIRESVRSDSQASHLLLTGESTIGPLETPRTAARADSFGGFQHAIVARFDACILGDRSDRSEPMAEQLTDRRGPARHAMDKSESIDGPQFFGREHDLQTLFPHQAGSRAHDPQPHDGKTDAEMPGTRRRKMCFLLKWL